jgi:hypothetical protein
LHKPNNHNLIRDLAIVFLSVVVAYYLWQSNLMGQLIADLPNIKLLGAFIAGFFFTSIFTIAPATAALVEIIKLDGLLPVALAGAMGAVLGDYIIFKFVRDHLTEDFLALLKKESRRAKIRHIFQSKLMRFSLTIVGGLLIAAPFPPDEVGLSVLGLAKTKTNVFLPISFFFNFIGILFIGWLTNRLMVGF